MCICCLNFVFAAFAPFAANIIHSNRTQKKTHSEHVMETSSFPNKPRASLKRSLVSFVWFVEKKGDCVCRV